MVTDVPMVRLLRIPILRLLHSRCNGVRCVEQRFDLPQYADVIVRRRGRGRSGNLQRSVGLRNRSNNTLRCLRSAVQYIIVDVDIDVAPLGSSLGLVALLLITRIILLDNACLEPHSFGDRSLKRVRPHSFGLEKSKCVPELLPQRRTEAIEHSCRGERSLVPLCALQRRLEPLRVLGDRFLRSLSHGHEDGHGLFVRHRGSREHEA